MGGWHVSFSVRAVFVCVVIACICRYTVVGGDTDSATTVDIATPEVGGNIGGTTAPRSTAAPPVNTSATDVITEALASGPAAGDVRFLAESLTYGLLEYFHNGTWKLLCQQEFDNKATKVACHQLSYEEGKKIPANMFYSEDTKPMVKKVFNCTGTEDSLITCRNNTALDTCTATSSNYLAVHCYGSEDELIADNDVQVKTSGAHGLNNVTMGRVEIGKNGIWAHPCATEWGDEEATVFCKQLGKEGGTPLIYAPAHGTAYLPDHLTCLGDEDSLSKCTRDTLISCPIAPDTAVGGVLCHDATDKPKIQIRNETGESTGLVQVVFGGHAGTICGSEWGETEAQVVCNSQGYMQAENKTGTLPTSLVSGDLFLLDHVKCLGREESLFHCTISGTLCRNSSLHAYALCSGAIGSTSTLLTPVPTSPVPTVPSTESSSSSPESSSMPPSSEPSTPSSTAPPPTSSSLPPAMPVGNLSTSSEIQQTTTLEPPTITVTEQQSTKTNPITSSESAHPPITLSASSAAAPMTTPNSIAPPLSTGGPTEPTHIPSVVPTSVIPPSTPKTTKHEENEDEQRGEPQPLDRGPNVGAIIGVVLVIVVVIGIGGYVFWKKRHHVFKHQRMNEGFVRFDSEKTTLDVSY